MDILYIYTNIGELWYIYTYYDYYMVHYTVTIYTVVSIDTLVGRRWGKTQYSSRELVNGDTMGVLWEKHQWEYLLGIHGNWHFNSRYSRWILWFMVHVYIYIIIYIHTLTMVYKKYYITGGHHRVGLIIWYYYKGIFHGFNQWDNHGEPRSDWYPIYH